MIETSVDYPFHRVSRYDPVTKNYCCYKAILWITYGCYTGVTLVQITGEMDT